MLLTRHYVDVSPVILSDAFLINSLEITVGMYVWEFLLVDNMYVCFIWRSVLLDIKSLAHIFSP